MRVAGNLRWWMLLACLGSWGCLKDEKADATPQTLPLSEHPAAQGWPSQTIPVAPAAPLGIRKLLAYRDGIDRATTVPRGALIPLSGTLAVVFATADEGRWELVWAQLRQGWRRTPLTPSLATEEVESLDAVAGPDGRGHLALRTRDGRLLYGDWVPGEEVQLETVPVAGPIPASGALCDVALSVSPAGRVGIAYSFELDDARKLREVRVVTRDLGGAWAEAVAVPADPAKPWLGLGNFLTWDVQELPVLATTGTLERTGMELHLFANGVAWTQFAYSDDTPLPWEQWRGWGDLFRLPDGAILVAPGTYHIPDYWFGVFDSTLPQDVGYFSHGVKPAHNPDDPHLIETLNHGGRFHRQEMGYVGYYSYRSSRSWPVDYSGGGYEQITILSPVLADSPQELLSDTPVLLSHGEYASYPAGLCYDDAKERFWICHGAQKTKSLNAVDNVPAERLPVIVESHPADGATQVPVDTDVTLRFSVPVEYPGMLYIIDLTVGDGVGEHEWTPGEGSDQGPLIPALPPEGSGGTLEVTLTARPEHPLLPGHDYLVMYRYIWHEDWWYPGFGLPWPQIRFTTAGTAVTPEPMPFEWLVIDYGFCAEHPVSGALRVDLPSGQAATRQLAYLPALPAPPFFLETAAGELVPGVVVVTPEPVHPLTSFAYRFGITWDPPLAPDTEYRLRVHPDFVTIRGTRPAVDDPGVVFRTHHGDLAVIASTVQDGAVGVHLDGVIDLTFNAALDATTIAGAVSLADGEGQGVPMTVGQLDARTLRISTAGLIPLTAYTITITDRLRPVCGGGFTAPPWIITFTTGE